MMQAKVNRKSGESYPHISHPFCRQRRRMWGLQWLWTRIQDLYFWLPRQSSEFLPAGCSKENGLSRTSTGPAVRDYVNTAQDRALSPFKRSANRSIVPYGI